MQSEQDLTLGTEFPPASQADWLALVDKVLAGAPFDRRLVSATYDGLRLQPLYTGSSDSSGDTPPEEFPGQAPFTRGASAARRVVDGWDVRQYHAGTDPAALNAAVLESLRRGATSVALGPIGDTNAARLGQVLDGVLLDVAPIALDWGADALAGLTALHSCLASQGGLDTAQVRGEAGIDPLAYALDLAACAQAAAGNAERWPGLRALRVDASWYANAGAPDADEIAFALATGIAYLRALTGAGLSIAEACGQLSFTVTASADQFATIAELRAIRRCWARVAQACGAPADAARMALHTVTSLAMFSQRDLWVNPLRSTLACFAAAVGGADSITVLPMGAALGRLDADSQRLARNTQIMLAEECGLARVIDPAGGSWFVERYTAELAQTAWATFQAIEGRGGMAAVLGDGWAAARVDAAWQARQANLVRRRDQLTGVSEFPNMAEALPVTANDLALASGGAFPLRRHAAPFEALRDQADALATRSQRPSVFLANLGPIAVHTARAGFATNFFGVAGIEVIANDGFADAAGAAEAFAACGSTVAVICSSDDVYEQQAEAIARSLRAAGATRIYLAGNPAQHRDAYLAAGIDDFIYVGCEVVAVLSELLSLLASNG